MLHTLLDEFRLLLNRHDWYYYMSDDSSERVRGMEESNEITKKAKEIVELGGREQAVEIWKELAATYSYSDTQFEFPIKN